MIRFYHELKRVFIVFVLVTTFKNVKSEESFDIFPSAKGVKLDETPNYYHLLVDKVRKQVFISAVNCVYQLMPNLTYKSSFPIIPRFKHVQIQNKLLTIYQDELIHCETHPHGICFVHDVSDTSILKEDRSIPIPVEINEKDTYVAVITGNQEKLQQKTRDKSRLDFAFVLRRDNKTRFLKDNLTGLNEYDTLLIIEKGDDRMNIFSRIKYPNKYFINYIYGFHYGEFTYFITTLKNTSPDSHYTSILSRVSNANKSSDHLNSEISIECKLNKDSTFDLVQAAFVNVPSSKLATLLRTSTNTEVLFVVFAQSKHFQEDTSGTSEKASALCMYSLSEIEKKFIQNEKITAEESQNMITNSTNSEETRNTVTSAEPVIIFDSLITAVTFTAFHDYTVAFVGTHNGHLKEMIFEDFVNPYLRSDVPVDEGSPVNSDLFFDWTGDYLYALTEHKLTRIKVCQPNCLGLVSYWDCAATKNPNYGWCSINNKCSMKKNCSDERFWTSCESGKCSVILNVIPSAYSLESSYSLQFTIQPIPHFQGQLMCVFRFDDTVLCTNAISSLRSDNNVKCNVPDIHLIPTVLPGHHDIKAKISINTTKNPEFAEIDYTFYDCGTYTSCLSCVSSFLCNWCVSKNKCLSNIRMNCKNSNFVGNHHSDGCESEQNKDVVIAANTEKEMEVHAVINEIERNDFLCKFQTNETEDRVTAFRTFSNKIKCSPYTFNYKKKDPSTTGSLTVLQKISETWDTLQDISPIQFIIYKCYQMSNNCTTCSSLNKTYNCGWCQKTHSCEIETQCSNDSSHWTNTSLLCEEPSIIFFSPEVGLRDGKTIIRISVTNLPQYLEIDRYNITIADVPCTPVNKSKNELYCQVKHDSSSQIPAHARPVVININRQRIESTRNFLFVQPKVEHFSPDGGPIEGGTTLTLKGEHLNAGNLIEVFINDLPCEIFENTLHEIKCKTTPSQKPLNGSIIVKFNGKACTFENNSYEYVDIPTKDIQFWPSLGPYEGGTNISILCKYPNRKYEGIINITVANVVCRLHKHSCEPGQEIVCEIERDNSRRINAGPILLHIRNFIVESLQNYTFVDPKIESFSPTQGPISGGTELSFKGKHMNSGRLVKILIDDSPCIIFANNTNEIKCFTSPCITCSEGLVSLLFDGNNRTFQNNTFRYRPTTKEDESAKEEVQSKPRGIPDGGIIILVYGINLQSAVNPQFCVINTNRTIRYCSECKPFTNSQINCTSPVISEYNNTYLTQHGPQQLDYVIQMVNTTDVEKMAINKTYPKFVLYHHEIVELLQLWQIDDINKYPQHMERGYIEPQRNIIVVNVTYLPGGENPVNQLTITAICVVIAISVLAFIAFLLLYHRNQKEIRKELRNMNSELLPISRKIKKIKINKPTNLDSITLDILEQLNITIEYHNAPSTVDGAVSGEYEMPFDSRWEFPRTNLILGKCLGQGEFGKVVKGKAHGIQQKDVTTSVAVKMLKDTHSDSDMVDLVSEMEVMKVIGSHKNVLRLLGCCTQGGDLLIITEYASYGNLQMFLRQHHSSDVKTVATIVITEWKLTDFAHQIAEGMEYLSSKKCIHRDLAARNILVFKDYLMKIADFGLTRHIRNEYYYRKTKDGRLPVKWMAPEAIVYGVYKTPSDVWSYGILLWEIFTLGGIPYPLSINMEQLIQSLRSGYRMEKPRGCSSKIYSLMRDCWSYEAEDRPTFTAIVQTLGKMLENNEVRSNLYWLNNKGSDYEENEYCLLENNLEENEPCLLENFLLRRHVQNCQ